MKHSVISYSIVGVWTKPVSEIPPLDRKFCLKLFDDPYQTEHGLTDEGFVIALNDNKLPIPVVKINPIRIQFIHRTIDELVVIIEKVVQEVKNLTSSSFDFSLKAVGVNTEHEWAGLKTDADDYLYQQYLLSKIKPNTGYSAKVKSLNFQLVSEKSGLYGITIEPRANNKKALFCNINDHLDLRQKEFPDENQIRELFNNSLQNLNANIFDKII